MPSHRALLLRHSAAMAPNPSEAPRDLQRGDSPTNPSILRFFYIGNINLDLGEGVRGDSNCIRFMHSQVEHE